MELVAGGLSNAIPAMLLNPNDVIKVKMQTQSKFSKLYYNGFYDCAKKIIKEEGIFTL